MISSKSSDSNQPASKHLVDWWPFSTDANRKETFSIQRYIEKICASENRKLLIAPSLLKWSLRGWLLESLERRRGLGIKPNTWNHRGWFEEKQNQKQPGSQALCVRGILLESHLIERVWTGVRSAKIIWQRLNRTIEWMCCRQSSHMSFFVFNHWVSLLGWRTRSCTSNCNSYVVCVLVWNAISSPSVGLPSDKA